MQPTVGILGSGQLSSFLVEAAHRLGLRVRVLASDPSEPAGALADEVVLDAGDSALREFLAGLEVVLFESENFDTSRLKGQTPRFVPSLEAIETLQDKLRQKHLLTELELPTAPYLSIARSEGNYSSEEVGAAVAGWIRGLDRTFSKGWILKTARGGYDGKGNWLGSDVEDAIRWTGAQMGRGLQVYAEERVAIRDELAVVGTRTASGETGFYPIVFTRQATGTCDWAKGPATSLGLEREIEREGQRIARAIAERTGLVGTFAVELFRSNAGEILVNEIAPRVHNSGHYTLDAATVSQFEQHVRAAIGRELGSFATAPFFYMKNCLGPRGASYDRVSARPSRESQGAAVAYYDYGKLGIRAGRKLGHINGWGELASRERCESEVLRAHETWQKETIERTQG